VQIRSDSMKILEIGIKSFLALIVGLFFYMLAMMMTTYDGLLSMIFQPISGTIITGIAVILLTLICLPLYLKNIWNWWINNSWISILIIFIGSFLMLLSWYPFKISVINPETQSSIFVHHPVLSVSGWFSIMFGIISFPLISLKIFKKWVKR